MDPLPAGRRIAALVGKADNAPGVIRAYHGSPHSFSRFDASRIGTGFGAADFAVGHNFASLPEVADYYRKTLPGAGKVYEVAIDSRPESLLEYERILAGEPGGRAVAALRSTRPPWIQEGRLRELESGVAIDPMQQWAVVQAIRGMAKSPAGAAALLRHGIHGVSHSDPTRIGAGTRNYVMFPGTEDRISILRQYGLLPPLAAAGISQEE